MVNYMFLMPTVSLILHFAQCKGIKTLFKSGFHAMDSRFQVLNYRFFASGSWISINIGIPDFLRSILDYKNPGFRIPEFQIPKQKLTTFWYSNSLMWGETLRNEGTLGIHTLYSSIYIYYIYFSNTFLLCFKHHTNTSLTDQ